MAQSGIYWLLNDWNGQNTDTHKSTTREKDGARLWVRLHLVTSYSGCLAKFGRHCIRLRTAPRRSLSWNDGLTSAESRIQNIPRDCCVGPPWPFSAPKNSGLILCLSRTRGDLALVRNWPECQRNSNNGRGCHH